MARPTGQVLFCLSCSKRFHEVSAPAQTQHSHCLPLKQKTKSLERRCVLVGAVVGLLHPQFSSVMVGSPACGGNHFTLPEGIQIHPSQADSSAGSLALSKLRVILFFCGVHNWALHLTYTVTGCRRWNLLKMLTLNKGNLSESFLF